MKKKTFVNIYFEGYRDQRDIQTYRSKVIDNVMAKKEKGKQLYK